MPAHLLLSSHEPKMAPGKPLPDKYLTTYQACKPAWEVVSHNRYRTVENMRGKSPHEAAGVRRLWHCLVQSYKSMPSLPLQHAQLCILVPRPYSLLDTSSPSAPTLPTLQRQTMHLPRSALLILLCGLLVHANPVPYNCPGAPPYCTCPLLVCLHPSQAPFQARGFWTDDLGRR